jgi:hypothetical protein
MLVDDGVVGADVPAAPGDGSGCGFDEHLRALEAVWLFVVLAHRARLTAWSDNPGAVGSCCHDAHMTDDTVSVQRSAFDSLKAVATVGSATIILRELINDQQLGHARSVLPGDGFGRIVAGLWQRDPDDVALFLADVLAQLREHHPWASQIDPPISLDELLAGLQRGWPPAVPVTEFQELASHARRAVPRFSDSLA